MPDPIGGIVWLAWGHQDTSCFMPLYNAMTEIPRGFEIGDHWEFNRDSTRWAFDYADFHAQVIYSEAIKDVRAAQTRWETTRHRPDPDHRQERPGSLRRRTRPTRSSISTTTAWTTRPR